MNPTNRDESRTVLDIAVREESTREDGDAAGRSHRVAVSLRDDLPEQSGTTVFTPEDETVHDADTLVEIRVKRGQRRTRARQEPSPFYPEDDTTTSFKEFIEHFWKAHKKSPNDNESLNLPDNNEFLNTLKIRNDNELSWVCNLHYTDLDKVLQVLHPDDSRRLLSVKHKAYYTALHCACACGNVEQAICIINYLASNTNLLLDLLKEQNANQHSVFEMTCMKGFEEIMTLIKGRRNETMTTSDDGDVEQENGLKWFEMVEQVNQYGRTSLHGACVNGKDSVVQEIFDIVCGESPSIEDKENLLNLVKRADKNGRTVLHDACSEGHHHIVKCILEKIDEVGHGSKIKNLLQETNFLGKRPMNEACSRGYHRVVRTIAECVPSVFPEIVTSDDFHEACKNGYIDIVDIMFEKSNEKGLKELLCETDENTRTAFHEACRLGHEEIVKRILHRTKQMCSSDQIDELIKATDELGRTALHDCARLGNSNILRLVLRAVPGADQMKVLLLSKDTYRKNVFWHAFEAGQYQNLHAILQHVRQFKISKEIVCSRNKNQQTVLHFTCKQKYPYYDCVQRVVHEATELDILIELIVQLDEKERTFMWYLAEASSDVAQLLVKTVTDWDIASCEDYKRNQTATKTMTQKETEGKTNKINATDNNTNDIMDKVDEKLKSREITFTEWSLIKTDIFGESVLEHTSETDQSVFRDVFAAFQHGIKPPLSVKKHILLHDINPTNPSRLLLVLAESRSLPLIQHAYTESYLDACWSTRYRYILYAYFLAYIVQTLSLTIFVALHKYVCTDSESSPVKLVSSNPSLSLAFQVILLVFTVVCLAFELMEIHMKVKIYPTLLENYSELVVGFSCILLSTSAFKDYAPWQHHLGILTILVAWTNLVWLLAKMLPDKYKWVKEIRLRIIMLFSVMKSILYFLPLCAICLCVMSVVYFSHLHCQENFTRFDLALMRIMAMAIGELDFDSIFYVDIQSAFFGITCVIFVIFLGIMNLSFINLLIGIAVNDVNKLRNDADVQGFRAQVYSLMEIEYFLGVTGLKRNSN